MSSRVLGVVFDYFRLAREQCLVYLAHRYPVCFSLTLRVPTQPICPRPDKTLDLAQQVRQVGTHRRSPHNRRSS